MQGLGDYGPDRAERLVERRKGVSTTLMLIVVLVYEGDQRPCVDKDHRRLRARSTSISRTLLLA